MESWWWVRAADWHRLCHIHRSCVGPPLRHHGGRPRLRKLGDRHAPFLWVTEAVGDGSLQRVLGCHGAGGGWGEALEELLEGGRGLGAALVARVGTAQRVGPRGWLHQWLMVIREVAIRVGAPELIVPLLTEGEKDRERRRGRKRERRNVRGQRYQDV